MTERIQIHPTNRIDRVSTQDQNRKVTSETNFDEALSRAQNLKFSKHAQQRINRRKIALDDRNLADLASAIDKAEQRGGQDSLILMDDLAFIVNVRDRMVVTALDTKSRGEGVFTQIDSVVIADKSREGHVVKLENK